MQGRITQRLCMRSFWYLQKCKALKKEEKYYEDGKSIY